MEVRNTNLRFEQIDKNNKSFTKVHKSNLAQFDPALQKSQMVQTADAEILMIL